MSRLSRRRRQRPIFLGNFYLNPNVQYLTTIVSAIALAGFVFSGFLLFRFTDEEDLINRGRMQLMEGKVAWAAQTFETLVNHHQDSYEGHLLLGQAYLQLDKRAKAEQEFEIAASLKSKTGDNAPQIALSKVAMAQKDFLRSENILRQAWKKNRQDDNVRQALFELYDQWGNALGENEPKDYSGMVQKYRYAMQFVSDYDSQHAVEEKLVEAIHENVERLRMTRDYPEALRNLKISLQYKYLPDTLTQIADIYSSMNQLDDAIEWYRKAFSVSPGSVGLRLTNVLLQKGQQLVDAKKPEEAKAYFDEADQISQDAKIPLDDLYPVSISSVDIEHNMDAATGEFSPVVTLRLSNDSSRDLNYLAVKAEFTSGNETTTLAEVVEKVVSPETPLPMRSTGRNTVRVKLSPQSALNIHALTGGKLTVKISIAYRDGSDAVWRLKSIQEAVIQSGTSHPSLESKPV